MVKLFNVIAPVAVLLLASNAQADLTKEKIQTALDGLLGETCTKAVEKSLSDELVSCLSSSPASTTAGSTTAGSTTAGPTTAAPTTAAPTTAAPTTAAPITARRRRAQSSSSTTAAASTTTAAAMWSDECEDKCLIAAANFMAELTDAECFPTEKQMQNATGDAQMFLMEMEPLVMDVMMYSPLCAKSNSNGELCGKVATVLQTLETESPVTEDTCQTFVDFGACIGTFLAALEDEVSFEGDFSDINAIAVDIAACVAAHPDLAADFKKASDSTVAPGLSSASTVTTVAALVGASVLAALFA